MKSNLRTWAIYTGPFVTLALSFGWTSSTDSFKLLALGIVAGFALAPVILAISKSASFRKSPQLLIAYVFCIGLFLPIFFSNSPMSQQVYGVSGRYLGLLHYLFLVFVFLRFSTIDFEKVWLGILKSLVILGVFEACYGGLQSLGLDPAPWKNPEKWMLGTFGNPNYLSSFLAFSAISTIYLGVLERRTPFKLLYLLTAIYQFVIIVFSNSSQGLILVLFGVCAITTILCFNHSRILGLTSVLISITLGLTGLLGIFQLGPLSKYLYQESVSIRGDYWRAGLRMFQENWLHGVGLDSYGDYYRLYRDSKAASRGGVDVFSNSAHNLLIDLAATGGIPLILGYLFLIGLVVVNIMRVFKESKNISRNFLVLVVLWIAFNMQTLISINVPSIAIWGWIFSGLIIAYGKKEKVGYLLEKRRAKGINNRSIPVSIICCIFCIAVVSPLISRDVRLANALAKNQIAEISNVIIDFPRDADQIAGVAIAYQKLGYASESLELAKRSIAENRNSVRAWRVIHTNDYSTLSEKEYAEQMLSKLDPFQTFISG